MHIKVKLYATLRRYGPPPLGAEIALAVDEGATVQVILRNLGIPDSAPLISMLNTRVCTLGDVLHEGDTLTLFPPVVGG